MNAIVKLSDNEVQVVVDGSEFSAPCGAVALTERHFTNDPPYPEELTNAIGEVLDHLEDARRELQNLAGSPVTITGALVGVVAAIELGHEPSSTHFVLTREAAEDVFRTLATEATAERSHNPGLPECCVDSIVGACCVIVAVMRGLQLNSIEIVREEQTWASDAE